MKKYLYVKITDVKPKPDTPFSGHFFEIPEYRDKLLWHGVFFTELFKKIYRIVRQSRFEQ